jgi:hypothetical protein
MKPTSILGILSVSFFVLTTAGCGSSAAAGSLIDVIPPAILDFIETGKGTVDNPGFLKYAYGNIAEGLYNRSLENQELKALFSPLIGKLVASYLRLAPPETDGLKRLGDQGNYLANLNLLLAVYKKLTGKEDYADLNRRLTLRLVEGSRADRYRHFPSFPAIALRWPADQSLILYTIKLYDENYSTAYAAPLYQQWKDFLDTGYCEKQMGLPVSEVTGKTATSRLPRGCATSYLILYTAKFDRAGAGTWFAAYKKYFLKDYFFAAGFRETASGTFKADADSGPIIDGVAAAATVFGIGAAYATGDDALAVKLQSLIDMGKRQAQKMDARTARAATDIVAQAIEFNMASQKNWRRAAENRRSTVLKYTN